VGQSCPGPSGSAHGYPRWMARTSTKQYATTHSKINDLANSVCSATDRRRATAHPKQHCTHFAMRLSRPTPQLSFESTVEVRSNVAANVVARPCAHSPTPRWLTPAGLGDRHLLHSNRTVFEARSPPVGGSRADGLRAAPFARSDRSRLLTDFAGAPTISRFPAPWGHSSAGRAPAWHAGGRRFDPAWLHHVSAAKAARKQATVFTASPSSRGLGHYPFTVATGVRIPVGTPLFDGPGEIRAHFFHSSIGLGACLRSRIWHHRQPARHCQPRLPGRGSVRVCFGDGFRRHRPQRGHAMAAFGQVLQPLAEEG